MKKVRIAIIDSGINYSIVNDDVRRRICPGYIVQDDPDMSMKKVEPQDMVDMNGHGTVCASIINRLAPEAELIPICVLNKDGRCSSVKLAAALGFVLTLDVQIINMSLSSNDLFIWHKLKKLTSELEKRGKVCVAAKSNDRRISFPADFKSVIGVVGETNVFNDGFEYERHKKIQVTASGAPELMEFHLPGAYFFKGNSKAAAIVSGILANAYANEKFTERKDVEKFLEAYSWSYERLYTDLNDEEEDKKVMDRIAEGIRKMIDEEYIRAGLNDDMQLEYSKSTIYDFYKIINMLEEEFSCKIFGRVPVYRTYFKKIDYLGRLVKEAMNE